MARLKHPGRVGISAEHKIRDDLLDHGYYVVRAAASKGPADLVAVGANEVLFVQAKRTENGQGVGSVIGPVNRRSLAMLADRLDIGYPIVAIVRPRKPIEYYALTGFGPKDFFPFELQDVDISVYTPFVEPEVARV